MKPTMLAMFVTFLVAACSADLPEGQYECAAASDCPDQWSCWNDGLCYSRVELAGSGGTGGTGGTDADAGDSGMVIPDVDAEVDAVVPMPCDAVWIDCDGDDSNGCEYQSNVGSPVPHNRGGWINCPDTGCTRDCDGCRTDGIGSAQSIYEVDGGWMGRNESGLDVCKDRGI